MAEPKRITPFDQFDTSFAGGDAISLSPLPPTNRWSLRADETMEDALVSALKLEQAPAMLMMIGDETGSLARLGPDEYLLSSTDPMLGRAVGEATNGQFITVTDISHRLVGIKLTGGQAANTINGACPLDLHHAVTPIGTCTRTIMSKAEIILHRLAKDEFKLLTNRSYAEYLWNLLCEVAREHRAPAASAKA